mmetsp:Transcript_44875/g.108462  ORF Transcript_44875/g.108462 Transcript_44875/m.108462 type:complete len:105 (-) Transcript_44875:53-367(-)
MESAGTRAKEFLRKAWALQGSKQYGSLQVTVQLASEESVRVQQQYPKGNEKQSPDRSTDWSTRIHLLSFCRYREAGPVAIWNQRVQELKNFYEKHGHFKVPNNT